jgi:hypothetical protein
MGDVASEKDVWLRLCREMFGLKSPGDCRGVLLLVRRGSCVEGGRCVKRCGCTWCWCCCWLAVVVVVAVDLDAAVIVVAEGGGGEDRCNGGCWCCDAEESMAARWRREFVGSCTPRLASTWREDASVKSRQILLTPSTV